MKSPAFWHSLSPRTRKRLKWAAGLLLTYTIVGFLILPFVIRLVAIQQLAKELHREVSIEKVRLNPYAMSIAIRGLKIKDPDAETLLSWDEVYVNFQLTSIFSRAWSFKEIAVVNPYARVQLNKDRTLNFSDIIAAHTGTNAPVKKNTTPTKPPALHVGQMRIEGARVAIADLTPKTPFRRIIGPVKVSVTDFRTDPNSRNPHVFTGSTETGETFTWGGHFSTDPLGAVGELGVENVALNKLAPLYQDFVNFEIRDGVAGFQVNYQVQLGQTTNLIAISNTSFSLRSFKLAEPGHPENLLELPELSVTGVSGDFFTRRAEVKSVTVRGANVNVLRARNTPFNLIAAAQPNTNQAATGGIMLLLNSATNLFAQLINSTNQASGLVRAVDVQDCAVTLRDDALDRPVSLRVDQINVSARNLSNRPDTNLLTSVSLRWNTNGTVKVDLDAALDPLMADLRLQVAGLELAPLSPYLDSFVNLYVLGSKVGLDSTLRLRAEPGQLPTVTFTGSTRLDDLNLVSGNTSADLLTMGSLRVDGITANLNPPAVTVANIALRNLTAHVRIETNGAINVLSLMREGDTNAPAVVANENEAAAPAGGSAIQRAFAQVKSLLGMETNSATASLPKATVNAISVENAELQFTDRSVTPPAQAAISRVNVTVQNISTEELGRAQVHLTALASGTGQIELTAQLNPLRAKEATEAKVSLKRVRLNPGDPYAGKFLGYRLTRGELNVDVDYTITASQVKGRNLIVLDQLTLGNKVASTNAIALPVKLGIALLKDSSGKIELDVPVAGNLDDPTFRIGKVVWGVIGNIFVKAVTSPFSLLGSLVGGGGGEAMQFQEFAPGSAELDVAAREKLATLAKALAARPELQIEIEGNVEPARDGEALRRARLELQLRTTRWNSLRAAARTNTTPEQLTLAPEDRSSLLAKTFRDALKANPQLAVTTSSPTSTNAATITSRPRADMEKGATRLMNQDTSAAPAATAPGAPSTQDGPNEEQMIQALLPTQPLTDEDFFTLASRRAEQVRAHLVEELKVAADRVFVAQGAANSFATNGHRVNLQLR